MKSKRMEKEIARRELMRRSSLEEILCAHATARDRITRDPVFPDWIDTSSVARASAVVAPVTSSRGGNTGVVLTYKRAGGGGAFSVTIDSRAYKRVAKLYSGTRFHSDLWLAVYRYQTLGLFSGDSGSVPARVYLALKKAEKGAVECFSSFFNTTLPGYYGLFPDIERPFGCKGNFFDIRRMKPLMLCNPPFHHCVMNAFVDRMLELLEASGGQCLAVLPAFDTSHRSALNRSGKCAQSYPVDYVTDVRTEKLLSSPRALWSGLYCKESFAYVDMSKSKTVFYTSTLVCFLSSLARPQPRVLELVRKALPAPDIEPANATEIGDGDRIANRKTGNVTAKNVGTPRSVVELRRGESKKFSKRKSKTRP